MSQARASPIKLAWTSQILSSGQWLGILHTAESAWLVKTAASPELSVASARPEAGTDRQGKTIPPQLCSA